MSDIENRDELERRLARKLGKLNRVQLGRLLEYLGDPPLIANVPASFWDEAGMELAQALAPFLEEVYIEQSLELMNSQPIGIDPALINWNAVNWATDYTFDLVKGIDETSRQTLQRVVGDYYEKGQTMGAAFDELAKAESYNTLTRRLERTWSPARAEMIAVTEITRAATEGERMIARELNKEGVQMIPIWHTNNDALVCSICAPRNGQEIKDDLYPPAHPRCRCWIGYTAEFLRGK